MVAICVVVPLQTTAIPPDVPVGFFPLRYVERDPAVGANVNRRELADGISGVACFLRFLDGCNRAELGVLPEAARTNRIAFSFRSTAFRP
jgi:hypothetical protein